MSIAINLRHKVDLQTPQQVRHIGTLINQNDSGAHHVVLELTDGGEPAQLDGYTVLGAFARADGNVVMLGGTIDGSTVDVELTSACYAVPGPCMLSIKLTGEEMRTVYKAAGSVDTETDGDLVTDEQYSTFDEMVGKIVQEYLRDHPVQAVETDPTVPEWAKQPEPPKYTKADIGLSNVANVRQYSANNPPPYPVTSVNGMTGDVVIQSTGEGGGITIETDPTVPAWAKAQNPPTYTAEDVGLGNVDNVRQYSAGNPPPYPVTSVNGMTGDVVIEPEKVAETDPTVPAWAKEANPPAYTATDVGAAPATEDGSHPGCYYRMVNGVKEWINPPMVLGEEYRTTERYNGKPVYTKLIDFGVLPNATEKIVGHNIYDLDLPISLSVSAKSSTWSYTMPASYAAETAVLVNKNGAQITTTVDRSAYTATVLLKYTRL